MQSSSRLVRQVSPGFEHQEGGQPGSFKALDARPAGSLRLDW